MADSKRKSKSGSRRSAPAEVNSAPAGLDDGIAVDSHAEMFGVVHVDAAAAVPLGFDAGRATALGKFVEAAYSMYDAHPNELTPAPQADFPAGYTLTAWVQMNDFLITSTGPQFYGFIARNNADGNDFVLAIRGTETLVEWIDNLTSLVRTPFKVANCGWVGSGFAKIYGTLKLVSAGSIAAAVAPLKQAGDFADQVAALVQRQSGVAVAAAKPHAGPRITVVAHSLGGALATLYAVESVKRYNQQIPLVCTFASPLVGDSTFATAFNGLGVPCWRIANLPDIVPTLPPSFFGFVHVERLVPVNSSSKVKPGWSCAHAMTTYLHMLDASQPVANGCRLPVVAAVVETMTAPVAASVDEARAVRVQMRDEAETVITIKGATINLTINVGK